MTGTAYARNGTRLCVSPIEPLSRKLSLLYFFQRYLAYSSIGAVSHAEAMRGVELFGTQVAPIVQSETAPGPTAAAETRATAAS